MKHYRMIILAVLLTLVGRTMADNLTVETVKMSAGETKQVAIVLNNPTHKYAAFQFDLVLPEGISIAKNNKGKFIATLNEDRKDDHTLNVSETGTNTYRFLAFSMTNTEFYGTEGALVYVTLQASEGISGGDKTATIQSQVFTEVSGEQYKWDDTTFTVEIGGGGGSGDPNPPVVGDDMLSVEAVSMSAGDTKQIAIVLNNPTHKYAAFQFDLVLPDGISIAKNNKGKFIASLNEDRKDDHTLNVSETGTNTYRFLAFSMTNTEFYGTEGALVYVTLQASESISEGNKTATIQSQVFTEVSGEQYKWSDKTFQIAIEAVASPITITAKSYSREYGADNPTFEYLVTGGTITSGTPTITCTATKTSPVGTYDIVIEKGTVSNKSVELINGTLTVTKAPLTITAKSYSIKQGEALPTFEAEYRGFKNDETASVLSTQPTITTSATSASEPGTYDIVVSGASATNYDISYVKGTLTITKADEVVVTAKSYSRKYGEANPTFEYTTSGATLTGTPSLTCEATATSPVGEYDIVISKGSITNYNVTYVNGKLTITKAPLTITAKSYTIKQGDALPTFEAEYSGFKNNETTSVLSALPTITTTATSASAPGTYDIVVSGASATNYDITYVKGTLTITAADLVTITANSYTITYGDALPEFGYTSTGADLIGTPAISCEATSTSSVGTYPIVISKGSVTNYNVSYVNGTLTIIQKEAALSWSDTEFTYNGLEQKPTATVTNLVGSDVCTVTVSGAKDAGSHTATATTLSNNNYKLPEAKTQAFTIAKAPLTITAKSYTIKQGDALPSFEAEYAGFKNNETASVLSTQPTITTTATSASEPGTYDITISGATASNYEITHVKGTLTITQADAIVVTANNYSRKYGEANPAFDYTVSGGTLAGTPSITCSASATSAVGEYDIVVSKGSVTNYNVTFVNGKLTVTKAPLTITAKSYTIKQGDALPTFEAEYSGFKNNETAAVLQKAPTLSTTATSASEPGTYEITVSGAEAQNYEISYVKGTLTITQADAIVVTAKSYSRKYGEANPTFEFTTSGAALTGTPSITCEATATSPVGEYDIVVSKGSVTNYNVTFVNGKLTVAKSPLTITAKSYSIKQGEALPTFEAEYSGFKNNETNSVLSTQPTISTTATSASEPGTYEITVSGASATNYDISHVKGTLTITKADEVVVTANSYTRLYGEANPTFEYTTSGATLTGTPSISCEATATSPVGEYDIVVSKGSVTNYNVTFVNGKLTVAKSPLTIKAKNYTIKQGESLPTFEAEYSGFKNNETASVLSAQPTITTSATSASAPGTYDIIVSGASATNYNISYVKGTLTISAVEVDPVTETETTTFSETVNENTDLSNTIIGNTYFTVNAENGDGYDATEQAIVLNSTTTTEQMNTVQNAQVGDATMQANYSGIIFEVPAGNGTVTVDAKTIGTHVLNVQIGNGEPTKITKSERGTTDVPYNVAASTYVYLYASSTAPSGAPHRAAAENSVLLYSYKVTVIVNGIQVVTYGDLENAKWYTIDGRQLPGKPTKKGLYIVNGRKVVM